MGAGGPTDRTATNASPGPGSRGVCAVSRCVPGALWPRLLHVLPEDTDLTAPTLLRSNSLP